MQIVINISNWLYNAIMECKEPLYSKSLGDAVRDGTPLPKGHGDLIDKKVAYKKFYSRCLAKVATEVFAEIPTIIEADKAGDTDGNSGNDI